MRTSRPAATAPRARSPRRGVAPGGEMEVTITAGGYGELGRVIETLPKGFSYARSTLPDSAVKVEGDTLKFTLLGEERFSYTVRAPAVEGQYSFSGALLDANVVREEVGGETLLRVGSEPTATPTPGPPATATAAPAPAATPTHTPEPTATSTPEPTATPQTTATPLPTRPTASAGGSMVSSTTTPARPNTARRPPRS